MGQQAYQSILDFWFSLKPKQWWATEIELDQTIKNKFATTLQQAAAGELYPWRQTAHGRLAEVIVLDQFSRNIYRNTPQAFSQDAQALTLVQEAIAQGFDKQLSEVERHFFYLPFMHSESKRIHEIAVELFKTVNDNALEFEYKHKRIIDQFGRYPHRNEILGRSSSNAEIEFLKQPGSSF